MSKERLYRIHNNMKSRCYLPTARNYKHYGGRGIKICDEWLGKYGFDNFYNWAIKNGYQDNLTIDRIDNDGDYSPKNCRWADMFQQNSNTRYNKLITYRGETKTITQWARFFNKDTSTINNRIIRGWSFEQAIKTPSRSYVSYTKTKWNKRLMELKETNPQDIKYDNKDKVHFIKFNNQIKSLSQWAKEFNISRQVLANRLRRGWKFEDAINRAVGKYNKIGV